MTLPSLQQRAVDMLPALIAAIKQHPPVEGDAIETHPAVRMIREHFSAPHDRMMGTVLMAYLAPVIQNDSALYNLPGFSEKMAAIVTGNVKVFCGKMRNASAIGEIKIPLQSDMYCMHRITQDVLSQQHDPDTACRLAASMALLAHPIKFPLSATAQLPIKAADAKETLERELGLMQEAGVNPFTGKTVQEIGGANNVRQMPQTRFFTYNNKSCGGQYANQKSPSYVSLKKQEDFFGSKRFDYVITANVMSPVVVQKTDAYSEAPLENGDLFCVCTNIVRPGGKIFHVNNYDAVNSPALFDQDLHRHAGVHMDEPAEGGDVLRDDKFWAYTKQDDRQVTSEGYRQWASVANKPKEWEAVLADAVQRVPEASATLLRSQNER